MSDYQRIERAIAFLVEHADRQPSLDEIAAHVHLSPFHFQRLFGQWAGTTPKRFLQALTLERSKALLAEATPLLAAAQEIGLSGSSRLHDHFVQLEAVTPGEFKRRGEGLVIRHGVHPTPFGDLLVAVTPRGVCRAAFLATLPARAASGADASGVDTSSVDTSNLAIPGFALSGAPARNGPEPEVDTSGADASGVVTSDVDTSGVDMSGMPLSGIATAREAELAALRASWPRARFEEDPAGTAAVVAAMFDTPRAARPGPLSLHVVGTNFQVAVWRALLRIPHGHFASYRQLAQAIGRPGASRAVGGAVGANPVALLIPCHRVIQQSGALGGYRWGPLRKRALLAWEQLRCDDEAAAEAPHQL